MQNVGGMTKTMALRKNLMFKECEIRCSISDAQIVNCNFVKVIFGMKETDKIFFSVVCLTNNFEKSAKLVIHEK